MPLRLEVTRAADIAPVGAFADTSKRRITNIGSLSGTFPPRDLGVYSMTKHAIEAFTDSLALSGTR